jgi:hypothetical protein
MLIRGPTSRVACSPSGSSGQTTAISTANVHHGNTTHGLVKSIRVIAVTLPECCDKAAIVRYDDAERRLAVGSAFSLPEGGENCR